MEVSALGRAPSAEACFWASRATYPAPCGVFLLLFLSVLSSCFLLFANGKKSVQKSSYNSDGVQTVGDIQSSGGLAVFPVSKIGDGDGYHGMMLKTTARVHWSSACQAAGNSTAITLAKAA